MATLTQNLPRFTLSNTANDRFKQQFGTWFWGSLIAATILHFSAFAFWPSMEAADVRTLFTEFEAVDIPPEVEIPPPPETIARPATPVIGAATIDQDITIAPTTFEDNPIENLPPPPAPAGASAEREAFVAFTPDMVRPDLKNRGQVSQALVRFYPPLLRDAGIGATVNVLFFIDERGRVVRSQVPVSSGYPAFDEAATKVAELMEFSPAMNRNQAVAVAVTIPITFQVQ